MANDAIDYINRDIVNVKRELENLNRIVISGNGQPPLTTQVATLQSDVKAFEKNTKEEIEGVKESINTMNKNVSEKNYSSWQFKTAILVALISSITSIYLGWKQNQSLNPADTQAILQLSNKIDKLLEQKK